MPSPRTHLGRRGESLAIEYLRRQGMRVLLRNFRTRYGEVDIVAEDKRSIVFVEVRTRRNDRMGTPEESVTPAKRARIRTVALQYLQDKRLDQHPWRVDVVAIMLDAREPVIRHYPGVDMPEE